MKDLLTDVISVLPLLANTIVSSLVKAHQTAMYDEHVTLPLFKPPLWLLGVLGTLVYSMQGVALKRAVDSSGSFFSASTAAYFAMLGLSLGWVVLLWRHRDPLGALAAFKWSVALLFFVTFLFRRVDPETTYFMAPSFAWAIFSYILLRGTVV